jgi:formylglycine-generating enzyme required for sulfatase activity
MIGASPVQPGPRAEIAWRDAKEMPVMVELPAGEFIMGENPEDKFADATERPAHRVGFKTAWAMGRFPVTTGEFREFCPEHFPADPKELPVVNVSWNQADAYCVWLTGSTGRVYRLPSEAEWEFACRAGSRAPFSCGQELTPGQANFFYDEHGGRIGAGRRTPVGSFPANAFGLHDLHGNVSEWVKDGWHPNYQGAPGQGAAWLETGNSRRVIRGGAWDYLPRLLRSSWRDWRPAEYRADNIGFRVATGDLRNSSA